MIKKQWLILTLLLTLLAQTACAPAATPTVPIPSTDTCPTETAELKLLTNAEDGYCLLYPAAYSTEIPHLIIINPIIPMAGDMPGDAWVSINVEPTAGRTAAQVADAQITEAGTGFNITQSNVTVDGEQAVVVDGLPGQDSSRTVFIVSHERLYTLTFLPWVPNTDVAGQPTPLEELYTTIINTLHFQP
jgi:hypothetical protein